MQVLWDRFRGLIIFTALYLAAAGIFYLWRGNSEFLIYVVVMAAIAGLLVATVEESHLDGFVLWGLSIWGFLHILAGVFPVGENVLYNWRIVSLVDEGNQFYILKMDQVIHFYGFAVVAIMTYELIAGRARSSIHPVMLIFFASAGAMGLGALSEVVEFFVFVSLDRAGVEDHFDLGFDLVFNMAGALTGGLLQQWRAGGAGVPEGAVDQA